MTNEFKKIPKGTETRYILESETAGTTGNSAIATVPGGMGGVRKRGGNLLAQEANKDKMPATKPRNFVAKNATTGGAGAHKDKKKAAKQGDVKHKSREMDMAEAAKTAKKEGFQNDEANLYYRYDTSNGRVKQRMVHNDEERQAMAQGFKDTPEAALKAHGIFRSKFDPKKFMQKQGDKYVEVFPFGQQSVAEEEDKMDSRFRKTEWMPLMDAIKILKHYGATPEKYMGHDMFPYYDIEGNRKYLEDITWNADNSKNVRISLVNQAVRELKAQQQGVAEGSEGSWVVYDGAKIKRFKTHEGAKAYAEKNGGKVASSEYYHDKLANKGVAGLDEAHHGSLLNPKKGQFASVIFQSQWDTDPQIDYYNNLDDAKFDTENASAHHGSVYAWNGARWVRKMSATERNGSDSGYGSWEENKQGVAEGDSGAKYKVKSIGRDSKGDYYISPNTGKKVYKQAQVGDHEVPGTGEIKKKVAEEWSQKYKSSINCSHPKGFSQKAHCAGKKKHTESMMTMEAVCPDCGMCETHGNLNEIKKGQKDANGFTRCWPGKHAVGTKKGKNGGQVRNCEPNEGYGMAGYETAKVQPIEPGKGIDKEIGENPDWYNDEANSMSTAQLKSLVKHAAKLRHAVKQMQAQGDTLEPWQQSKVTKAADYLDAVFNAVDDEHDMGESNHPDEKEDKALIRQMVKKAALKQEDSYMAELQAKLAEKIPKNAPVDVYIKDFEKSNAPQFRGKTKEKRREMAIAASYAAKNPSKKK